MMRLSLALIAIPAFLCCGAPARGAGRPRAPVGKVATFPQDHWCSADPEFLTDNWKKDGLQAAEAKWTELNSLGQSTALMIVHRGHVIGEFGDCESPLRCHSVRKSILNGIYGASIHANKTDVGKLLSMKLAAVPITEQGGIPEKYSSATIRDLMRSSSGVPLPAEYESQSWFAKRSDPERPAAPGERWAYSNWDFNALGTAFNTLTGEDLFAAFDRLIAGPTGMEHFSRAEHTEYFPAAGRTRKSLHPAYLFKLSAGDRARFGLLYLAGGVWDGERIIDEEWFHRSITDTIPAEGRDLDYGYMWWVGVGGQRRYRFPGDVTYSARGSGGQFIIVVPSRDLVVVNARDTGGNRDQTKFDGALFNDVFRLVADAQIIPE